MSKRNRNRTFHVTKKGKRVAAILDSMGGKFGFSELQVNELLDTTRVFAVDTESLKSLKHNGALKTFLTTIHYYNRSDVIETPEGTGMLQQLCQKIVDEYGEDIDHDDQFDQKPKRKEAGGGRNGRKRKIQPVLSVWFNLAYDFGRLASDKTEILRSTLVGADSFRVKLSDLLELEIVRMHFGSSSSFEWYIRDFDTNKIVRLLGLDLTGYWKTTLRNAAVAAGVAAKHDIPENWYELPREHFDDKMWRLFREYGVGDVRSTLELYHATVQLLQGIDARVVRKNGVIPPSAPGAAARIVFAMAFDMHWELRKANGGPGYWERPPTWVDQWGMDAYHGARVFSNSPGIHKNVITLDIKSAYPYAMASLPDPVDAIYEYVPACDEFDVKRFLGLWGVLYVDGEGLCDKYPALRKHDLANSRLQYIVGKFENEPATIAEVVIGVLSGTLRIDRIQKGVIMRGSSEKSFLRAGICKFFGIKNDPSNPKALRDMGKLLANSTYGKLVEVNEKDYSIFEELLIQDFKHGDKVARTIARIYAELGDGDCKDDYWGDTDDQKKLSRKVYKRAYACLDKDEDIAFLSVIDYINSLVHAGVALESNDMVHLGDFMRRFTKYRCGQYFMPLLAAQVTGLTSAIVGLAAKCLNALQGDTDSVHVILPDGMTCKKDQQASEIGLPGWSDFERILKAACYGQDVPGVPELGKWFCETNSGSTESVLCRPKVYSHQFPDGSFKQAKHGFASFPRVKDEDEKVAKQKTAQLLHDAIASLTIERKVSYKTRPSPRKLKAAVREGKVVGEFVSHEIEMIFRQDPNTYVDENGDVRWLTLEGEPYKRKK
jgi:hypothetical protein